MAFNDFFESGRNPKLASAGKTDVNGNPVDLPVVMIQGGTLTLDVSSVEIGEVVLKDGTTSNVATIDSSGRLSVLISGGAPDSLPLPSGAATSANQASALSSLGNITTAIGLQAKLSDTQPVSIASAVAVTGPLTDTQLRASAVPVSLTSTTITGSVAVTQSGTWNIGSITTLPVGHNIIDSGTLTSITNPVAATQSGTWNIGTVTTITGGNIAISNTPAVTLASTTISSGNIAISNTPAVTLASTTISSGNIAISNTPAVTLASTTITSGNITVNNGNLTSAVNIQDGGNSITVDGTFWQTTQPVSDANLELTQGAVGTSALGPVVMGIVLPTISGIPGTVAALPISSDGRVQVTANGEDVPFFYGDIWEKSELPRLTEIDVFT